MGPITLPPPPPALPPPPPGGRNGGESWATTAGSNKIGCRMMPPRNIPKELIRYFSHEAFSPHCGSHVRVTTGARIGRWDSPPDLPTTWEGGR